jgi:hypothetical protein
MNYEKITSNALENVGMTGNHPTHVVTGYHSFQDIKLASQQLDCASRGGKGRRN